MSSPSGGGGKGYDGLPGYTFAELVAAAQQGADQAALLGQVATALITYGQSAASAQQDLLRGANDLASQWKGNASAALADRIGQGAQQAADVQGQTGPVALRLQQVQARIGMLNDRVQEIEKLRIQSLPTRFSPARVLTDAQLLELAMPHVENMGKAFTDGATTVRQFLAGDGGRWKGPQGSPNAAAGQQSVVTNRALPNGGVLAAGVGSADGQSGAEAAATGADGVSGGASAAGLGAGGGALGAGAGAALPGIAAAGDGKDPAGGVNGLGTADTPLIDPTTGRRLDTPELTGALAAPPADLPSVDVPTLKTPSLSDPIGSSGANSFPAIGSSLSPLGTLGGGAGGNGGFGGGGAGLSTRGLSAADPGLPAAGAPTSGSTARGITAGAGTTSAGEASSAVGEGVPAGVAGAAAERTGTPPYMPPMGGMGGGAGAGRGGGALRPGAAERAGGPDLGSLGPGAAPAENVGVPSGLRGRSDAANRTARAVRRVRRLSSGATSPVARGEDEDVLDDQLWRVEPPPMSSV